MIRLGVLEKLLHFHIEYVAKKCTFGDKTVIRMALQSIENKILSIINRKNHGTILFASDFADAIPFNLIWV